MQHGDFQIGNIFYDRNTHTFTLIDLGDFAKNKRLILDPLYFIYFFSNCFGKKGVSNQEHFIERLKDENFKSKMSNMITSFITGYVSNLNPDVAKQMNKTIQEKVNLANVFYSGGKFMYGEGEDIIKKARKKIVDFLNPITRKAFATAYINAYGKNVSILKPHKKKVLPLKKSAPQHKKKDFSIKSLTQLPNLCKADTVKLDLSIYPNLNDLTGLGQCKNLKKLYLQDTKVSNIEEIGKLTNLEELDLSSSHVGWILPLAGYTLSHGSPIKSNPGCHKLKLLKMFGIKQVHGYYQLKNKLPNLTIKTSSNTEKY